jgi:hypothetical protein
MSEAEAQRQLHGAYREVLGYEGRETESQRLVRQDMERQIRNQVFRASDPPGSSEPAVRDGMRAAFKHMRDMADTDPHTEQEPRQALGAGQTHRRHKL